MPRPEDDFTSTVEGAAGYESWRTEVPDLSDLDDEIDNRPRRECTARDLSECFCEHH